MKILNNQSLLDLSIQQSGTALNWLEIAMANNVVPTDKITAGTEVKIPDFEQIDSDIVGFLAARNIQPATSNTNTALIPKPQLTCQEQIEKYFKEPCQ